MDKLFARLSPFVLAGMLLPLGMVGCSGSEDATCQGQDCKSGSAGSGDDDDSGSPADDAGPDGSDDGGIITDGGEKPTTAAATIGADGGTIEIMGLVLSIPAGALSEDKLVTVTRTSQPAPTDVAKAAYTPLYRFDPEGLVFDLPVSVAFSLSKEFLSKPLTVFWSKHEEPNAYEDVSGTLGKEAIVAQVTHFSTGFVGEANEAEDGGIVDGGNDAEPDIDGGGDADSGPVDDGGTQDPIPELTTLSSSQALHGTGDLPITVGFRDGRGPTGETILRANGLDLPTYRYSALALTTLVPASFLANAGTVHITAFSPRVGESNALDIKVVAAGNGAPKITQVSPSTVAQDTQTNTTIVVTGSAFISGATCFLGPFPATLSFANQGQVNCSLSAYAQRTAGDLPVRIVNPGPGGGASNAGSLTISGTNPPGEITAVVPSELGQNTSTIAVEITGTGLLPTTRIEAIVGSETHPLEFQYPYGILQKPMVVLPSFLLEAPGTIVLRAINQAPGGGSGATATLEVVAGNPTPQLTNVSPVQLKKGQSGQELKLTGSGFGAFSTVEETGTSTALSIKSFTNTQIVATVPDALVSQTGTLLLRVVNPGPGGGASTSRPITVVAPPTLTSITPSTVIAGSGSFQLTVQGTGLDQPGYRVIRVGTTQLFPGEGWTVTVPANVITTPGTLDVIAGIEGIGNSNALPLTVTAP